MTNGAATAPILAALAAEVPPRTASVFPGPRVPPRRRLRVTLRSQAAFVFGGRRPAMQNHASTISALTRVSGRVATGVAAAPHGRTSRPRLWRLTAASGQETCAEPESAGQTFVFGATAPGTAFITWKNDCGMGQDRGKTGTSSLAQTRRVR